MGGCKRARPEGACTRARTRPRARTHTHTHTHTHTRNLQAADEVLDGHVAALQVPAGARGRGGGPRLEREGGQAASDKSEEGGGQRQEVEQARRGRGCVCVCACGPRQPSDTTTDQCSTSIRPVFDQYLAGLRNLATSPQIATPLGRTAAAHPPLVPARTRCSPPHARTHARMHARTHARTRTRAHARTHARTRTQARTHTAC
jgi:hypothetical protein